MAELGMNLRREMVRQGTTIRELHLRARVDERTIKRILGGQSATPHGKTLFRLAKALGVSADALLDGPAANGHQPAVNASGSAFASDPAGTHLELLQKVQALLGSTRAQVLCDVVDALYRETNPTSQPDADGERATKDGSNAGVGGNSAAHGPQHVNAAAESTAEIPCRS